MTDRSDRQDEDGLRTPYVPTLLKLNDPPRLEYVSKDCAAIYNPVDQNFFYITDMETRKIIGFQFLLPRESTPQLGDHKSFPLSEIAPGFTLADCGCREARCEGRTDGTCHDTHATPQPTRDAAEGAQTSPIGQADVEALMHLADSMGFGRTHDMLRRVISATPYLSATPQPAPDAMRNALEREIEKARSLIACADNITYPSISSARYVRQNIKELIDAAEAALSAPVPPADGAGEPPHWREVEMMRLIDLLRSEEGDSVEIFCDNPDFGLGANNAVSCNGWWTGHRDRRFEGVSLLDALSAAMIEYKRPKSSDGGVGSQTRKELSADPQSLMAAGNVDSLGVASGPSETIPLTESELYEIISKEKFPELLRNNISFADAGAIARFLTTKFEVRPLPPSATEAAEPDDALKDLIEALENPDLESFDDEKSADARDRLAEAKVAAKTELKHRATPPVRGDREAIIALVGKHLGPHLAISPTPRYEAIVRTFADAILPVQLGAGEREAAIEECAKFIESGAGMADLIDQEELDQQAKYIRALSCQAPASAE